MAALICRAAEIWKPLHAIRQRRPVTRLHDQVDMVVLNTHCTILNLSYFATVNVASRIAR